MFPKLSIIGSSGRGNHRNLYNCNLFDKMIDHTKNIITNEFKLNLKEISFVSGGSAWADHIAVSLFLKGYIDTLYLYLPCTFNLLTKKFIDSNAGVTLNQLHDTFSKTANINSLSELASVLQNPKCKTIICEGFHARNNMVAQCNYMIAFTWGKDGNLPEKSGTKSTWDKCKSKNKIHIPLDTLNEDSVEILKH